MKIDDLINFVNVLQESTKKAFEEYFRRANKKTVEEARLPITFAPPPSDGVNDAITSIIEILSGADSTTRDAIASRLNEHGRSRLIEYSKWMATLAVRIQSPILIEQGLM